MRAYESWLGSKDHDKFAAAAVKCENVSGNCISDGYCHYGNCFGQADAEWKRQRLTRLRKQAAEIGYSLVKQ